MRNSACSVALALLVSGCASTGADFWIADQILVPTKSPKNFKVYVTDNLRTWCPNARDFWTMACTSCSFLHNECVAYVRPQFVTPGIIHHEKCHAVGYGHDNYGGEGTRCPADVDAIPHEIVDLDARLYGRPALPQGVALR